MNSTKMRMEQISVALPVKWKIIIEEIARQRSFEEKRKISYLDLIRETLDSSLGLSEKANLDSSSTIEEQL